MKKTIPLSIFVSIFASGALLATDATDAQSITITTVSKAPQILKNITSNAEVITATELEERHFTSVADALSSLGGISIPQNGGVGTTASLLMRGFDTRYTLILIDGVKYNDPSSADGAAQLSHLLVSDIERIEVIKGANPIWGTDAAAGVVNIVTKKAKKGIETSAQIEAGSFGTKRAAASVKYAYDKFDASASISRYLTDGFSAQAPKGKSVGDYEKDGYQNTSVNLKAGYDISKNLRIEGGYFTIHGLSDYDGWNEPNAIKKSQYDYETYKSSMLYRTASHDMSFLFSSTSNKKDELFETSSYNVKLFKGDIKSYEAKDSWNYTSSGTLVYGIAKEDTVVSYSKSASSEVKKDDGTKAVFASNTNRFASLVLTQALRYDDYSSFGSKTTGKIGAKYTSDTGASISTNYGTAFKTPTLTQMMNPWGSPNFDLKPENIKSFDITASHKKVTLTYFYNTVNNLINWEGGGYQNIAGTSTLQGYEAKYMTQITDDIVLNTTYARVRALDGSGKELVRRPHDNIGVNADWYASRSLHIGLYSSYVGTRYDTSAKTIQTGGYALFNGVVNYKIDKNLSVYGKFDNLLDREYQMADGYATAGRSVYVGMKAGF